MLVSLRTGIKWSRSVMSDTFLTPWIVACQALLSMEFSRQEYWNGLPFSTPGDLPDPGTEPTSLVASLVLAGRFFTFSATREALIYLSPLKWQFTATGCKWTEATSADASGMYRVPLPQGPHAQLATCNAWHEHQCLWSSISASSI